MERISALESEISQLKQKNMDNKLNYERDELIRQEISEKQRINPNYRRMRFLGEPKSYDQILNFSNELDKAGLYGPPREAILEELCVYASYSESNI